MKEAGKMDYVERNYRNRIKISDLNTYHVSIKETDLWISALKNLKRETEHIVHDLRSP